MNVQYAVKDNEVYVIEVNPRASRTVPFTSKALGIPLAKIATKVMLGAKLKDLGYTKDFDRDLETFNVKMPVFPFHKFPGVDTLLGPEMKSTGEVMGRAETFPQAYTKALQGAGMRIPTKGRAFLSVHDYDKPAIIDVANTLSFLGFEIEATAGTASFLKKNGVEAKAVAKYGDAEDNCVKLIREGRYQFVINTTKTEKAFHDSFSIRRTALEKKIPYFTLITSARAALRAIKSHQTHQFVLAPLKEDQR